MRKAWPAAVALLLITCSVAFASCGDSGGGGSADPALTAYFEQLAARAEELRTDGNELSSQLDGAQTVDDARAVVEQYPPLLREFTSDVEAMSPPSDVQDAHNDVVEKGNAYADAFDEAISEGADATTVDEFLAPIDQTGFTQAAADFQATCTTLQAIADDNDVNVDLECAAAQPA